MLNVQHFTMPLNHSARLSHSPSYVRFTCFLDSKCLPFFPAVLMRFCALEPRDKREKRQSEHVLVSRASREFWRNHLEFSLHFQAVDFRLNVFMLNNIIRSVINTIIGKICAAIIIKKNLRKKTRAAIANCATISLLTNLRYWQH